MGNVKVKTRDDYFASLEHERVLVEFSKDGDSPNCPLSWTWDMWIDGEHIDGTCEEASLARAVKDAVGSIDETVGELTVVRDYLMAYEVFGAEPDDGGVHHVISVRESGGRIMSRGFNMLRDYIENDALAMRRSKCREIEHELQREFEDLKVENNTLRVLCDGMYKDMQGVLDMSTDTVFVDSIGTLRDKMDLHMQAMAELGMPPMDYEKRMRELGIEKG